MRKTISAILAAVIIAYLFPVFSKLYSSTYPKPDSTIHMALSAVTRNVVKKVLAVETPEGAGALVRRSIGSMSLRNLTPFLMLDHFHVEQGGFPDHPHRGQSTVTYMLEGESQHEDSEGHKGTIVAGGVQWMTAGRGIIHAEMPINAPGKPNPRGLQLWVDLPAKAKMQEPSYHELGPEQIPTAFPEGPDGPLKVKIISGQSHGVTSPVNPVGGCWYFHFIFNKKSSFFQDLPKGWTAFLYILKGTVSVGSDTKPHEAYHTLVLSAKENETGVSVTAGEDDTQFVLIAGEPLKQEVHQYGPFVMSTADGVKQALVDYRKGQNGFEKAHTWRSIIGN